MRGFAVDVIWGQLLSPIGILALGLACFGGFAWLARGDRYNIEAYQLTALCFLLASVFFGSKTPLPPWCFWFDPKVSNRSKACIAVGLGALLLAIPLDNTVQSAPNTTRPGGKAAP